MNIVILKISKTRQRLYLRILMILEVDLKEKTKKRKKKSGVFRAIKVMIKNSENQIQAKTMMMRLKVTKRIYENLKIH